MKKVIIIYDDKKEKLISLATDEDYIEDIETDIAQIKIDRENDYHIVHTSKSKAAVEAAMKRIARTKGAIEYRRKEIAEINYYKIGLDFVSELVAKYDFMISVIKLERYSGNFNGITF